MTPQSDVLERKTRVGAGQRDPTAGERVAPAMREGRDSFAAFVAHELRTPLATQCALLELALADPNADVASWREIGEDVLDACRHQERMLEACLTLARSQGKAQRCEPVDLAAIAATELRAHNLSELESLVALEPACTSGDPVLLERLVANLVSNAIRHNTVGGRIQVATSAETGRAVLCVANTGPLIPASELHRLFQPFQRLNSNRRALGDGIGLGLAIVQAIANTHDATVTAQAPLAGGLAITVTFTALD
jgi:signal transduction histidine kinase